MSEIKINLSQLAKKVTVLSELMETRNKVDVDYIIKNFPDGFTVIEFDIATTDSTTHFPVLAIKEDTSICFFGGILLANICDEWVKAFDGSIEDANKSLEQCGGVKMKMETGKTKKGNNLNKITIL